MKYVFATVFAVLCLASLGTWLSMPEQTSKYPIVYWVTDNNPARKQQVAIFHRWLERKYGDQIEKEHGPGIRRCEMRVDTSSGGSGNIEKKLIQGTSGVLGEAVDVWCMVISYLDNVGMLSDITEVARQRGFDPSKTYPAMEYEITVPGRRPDGTTYRKQVAFPANVTVNNQFWVNTNAFRKLGLPPPPRSWDFEEFERLGKEYVKRANPDASKPRRYFFASGVNEHIMRRSLGLSIFNETMTRCILDDERNTRVLNLIKKWRDVDHLLPSASEASSMQSDAAYGGSGPQLFNKGHYALFPNGRYMLIQFRDFYRTRREQGDEPLDLAVAHQPCEDFPNAPTGTRACAVYVLAEGAKREFANWFLEYLAGSDYNMLLVLDADALPPNPAYTKGEAFRRPLPPAFKVADQIDTFEYASYDHEDPEEADRYWSWREEMVGFHKTYDRSKLSADGAGFDTGDLPAPPRPKAMSEEEYDAALGEFLHEYRAAVPEYMNEWDCHEVFSEAAEGLAIGQTYSEFIHFSSVNREMGRGKSRFMNDLCSAVQAGREMTERINREIDETVAEGSNRLRARFDELMERQRRIDELKEKGEKIPLELIENPFYRRYYVFKGMAE